jgi:hypothetical protein
MDSIHIGEDTIPEVDYATILSDAQRAELSAQSLINGESTSQIPNRYLKYMQREGVGPWDGKIDHAIDNTRNPKLGLKDSFIYAPNMYTKDLINMAYYHSYDQSAYFAGQKYNFDYYFSRDMITLEDDLGEEAQEKIDEVNSGLLEASSIISKFQIYLSRLERTAIDLKDSDTLDSLTFLHNLAKDGKKIVILDCHGCTGYTEDGSEILLIESLNGQEVLPADLVLNELSKKLDKEVYGAIFISSCNPDGIPINMESIEIPVIASLAVNSVMANPTKIYWPKTE